MTTELFHDPRFVSVNDAFGSTALQQTWLIKEIIKPELPNLIEHVEKCLELLLSSEKFRMPLSKGNMENGEPSIKGTITRQGASIVAFQAIIKLPEFHRGKQIALRMDPEQPFPLLQIESIINNLNLVVSLLDELQQLTELQDLSKDGNDIFKEKLRTVLDRLTESITLLSNPPTKLVFPHNGNSFLKGMMHESYAMCESTHHLVSVELVLFKNEISLDIRNLKKVTKIPWSRYDPETGFSFADKVRDKLKRNRTEKITEIFMQEGLQIEQDSIINNLISSFSGSEKITLSQANDLLARCVTFDGRVFTESEKLSITTSDPTLISVSAKLNGLESRIGNHFSNLENI